MRVDIKRFTEGTCKKCSRYYNGKLEFGECVADFGSIYKCARKRLFGQFKVKEDEKNDTKTM